MGKSEPAYVKTRIMAEILGRSVRTLLRWWKGMPNFPAPSRVGRRSLLWPREAVLAWVASNAATEEAAHVA